MRTRAILLVLAVLAVAGFAALNWGEFLRTSPLLFGPVVMDAPLGLILLTILALATIAFVLTSAAIRTGALIESRQHFKTLEAQRALADTAEASRFTELRTHLDTQLRELRQRDAISASEFEKAMVQSQRELRTQLEQMNRTLASRLNELEHRIDHRLGGGASVTAPVLRREVTTPATAVNAQVDAEQAREAVREEHARVVADRAHELQMQEDRLRERTAEDRPAQAGWRRWF